MTTEEQYVVQTIHEGSDWCVRKATASEIADPEEETLSYTRAADLATQTVGEMGGRWFDFSSDPAPDEEDEEDEISPERAALIALVRYLGDNPFIPKVTLPIELHAQVREALGEDFYREVR